MSQGLNSIDTSQQIISALDAVYTQDKSESFSKQNLVQELLKESEKYSGDSKAKREQAMQYMYAANMLEKLAHAVRLRAEQLKKNKSDKEKQKIIAEVASMVQNYFHMPIPKDATPELLHSIADKLERKAKRYRNRAEDLLKDSDNYSKMANGLKDQIQKILSKDMNISELRLKSIISHHEGLHMVFKKLGILKLDNLYKHDVEYANKKEIEEKIRS